ncbi:MAG: hypothetical protein ACKOW9_03240 [Candidatus Paceibacterota bacterium]
MASFLNKPITLHPALNPMVFNLTASNYTDSGFKWLMKLSGGTSSITNIGTFVKQITNNNLQYFEPSRLAQTQLGYSFSGDTSKLIADGTNNVAYIRATFSGGTGATLTHNSYVFNGYVDRNSFGSYNEFDFIPCTGNSQGKLLTPYLTRKVFLNDVGTLSMFNGRFASSTTAITSNNTYVSISAYSQNNIVGSYHIFNPYYGDSSTDVTNKRVTFPAYPKNINYGVGCEFYDNAFSPSPLFVGGYVGFVFLSPVTFLVGDRIQVMQYGGYTNESYNGLTTVTWISDDKLTVQTDKGWGVSTPAEGGIIYAYDRQNIYSANTTPVYISGTSSTSGSLTLHFDTSTGFNTNMIPYGTLIYPFGFSSTNYNLPVVAGSAVTSNKLVIPSLPFISNQTGYTTVLSRFVSGDIISSNISNYKIQMGAHNAYSFPVASAVTASANTIYNFGSIYTFNVDSTCSQNEDLFIAWQNKLGAFDFQNFRLRRDKKMTYDRNNYRKRIGGNTGTFSYTQNDFELNNFIGSQQLQYAYNTDWLDDTDSERILELVGSNVVFAKLNDVWTPIVCDVTDLQYQNKQNNKLAQYSLTFEATYKTYTQRQ